MISNSLNWSLRTVLQPAFEVVGGCDVNCWLNSFTHFCASQIDSLLKLMGWLSGAHGCLLSCLMMLYSFPAPFPRLISSRNSYHLAVLLVYTSLEISWFSSWIRRSPGKVAWRRSRSSARIAASHRKKGYTLQMRLAGMFLAATLIKVHLKRRSPTMMSLGSDIVMKPSPVSDSNPSQLAFLKLSSHEHNTA